VLTIRATASPAGPRFIWNQPMRIPHDGQRIAAAHHANQKMQIGKYRPIVRPSGSPAGLPFQSEKNATETMTAAAVAANQIRYFQRCPVALANLPRRNNWSLLLSNVQLQPRRFTIAVAPSAASAVSRRELFSILNRNAQLREDHMPHQ
jgi:hypothetical protein